MTMNTDNRKITLKTILPVIVLALGIVLLVLNIVIEDEPGALPLAVTLIGAIWLVVQRVAASKRKSEHPR